MDDRETRRQAGPELALSDAVFGFETGSVGSKWLSIWDLIPRYSLENWLRSAENYFFTACLLHGPACCSSGTTRDIREMRTHVKQGFGVFLGFLVYREGVGDGR
jgi:hypothetical protein